MLFRNNKCLLHRVMVGQWPKLPKMNFYQCDKLKWIEAGSKSFLPMWPDYWQHGTSNTKSIYADHVTCLSQQICHYWQRGISNTCPHVLFYLHYKVIAKSGFPVYIYVVLAMLEVTHSIMTLYREEKHFSVIGNWNLELTYYQRRKKELQ